MKGINTSEQDPTPEDLAFRATPKGEISNLTYPAFARERRPFNGPSPLVSFGNELKTAGTILTCRDQKINGFDALPSYSICIRI
jgi:hypothetical protein